ncbi:MAG: Uma2 family endonuclease [Nodosilinea sp.]
MEYFDNSTQLGGLINRKRQQVEVYCPGQVAEILAALQTLSREGVLPGFGLDLALIW